MGKITFFILVFAFVIRALDSIKEYFANYYKFKVFDLLRRCHLRCYLQYRENLIKTETLLFFLKEPRIDDQLSRTDINLIRPILLGFPNQYYFYIRQIKRVTVQTSENLNSIDQVL